MRGLQGPKTLTSSHSDPEGSHYKKIQNGRLKCDSSLCRKCPASPSNKFEGATLSRKKCKAEAFLYMGNGGTDILSVLYSVGATLVVARECEKGRGQAPPLQVKW